MLIIEKHLLKKRKQVVRCPRGITRVCRRFMLSNAGGFDLSDQLDSNRSGLVILN